MPSPWVELGLPLLHRDLWRADDGRSLLILAPEHSLPRLRLWTYEQAEEAPERRHDGTKGMIGIIYILGFCEDSC